MLMTETERGILLREAGEDRFDPDLTFFCGQCFRWREENGAYLGVAGGKVGRLLKTEDGLLLQEETPGDFQSFWKSYFDLEEDYSLLRQDLLSRCPALTEAAGELRGIRILRQEPWEALCSFIISQNNHIPRIRGIVERLCETFGEPLLEGLFSFPSPQALANRSVQELSPLRAGFRAEYLLDAARKVSEGKVDLSALPTLSLEEARARLMTIRGVGPKVAECTLLYGLHFLQAFPVDVWMKKALAGPFSGLRPEDLGPYAGLAQQWIFHFTRTAGEKPEKKACIC